MEYITLRLLTEDDLISALIREKTFCDYSHIEFILDDGTTLSAHLNGGVAIRPINYSTFTKIIVFKIPCTLEQKTAIINFAMAQVGKSYDINAIIGMVLNRDWRDPSKWFCSELITAAFEQGKLYLVNPDAIVDRITPRDDLISPLLYGTQILKVG